MQQHIAATWPASSSSSDAVAPQTDAVYSVKNFPHVRLVHVKFQEFRLGLDVAVRIIVVLPPHHVPYFCGALLYPAWWDMSSPVVRNVTWKKMLETNPHTLHVRHTVPFTNFERKLARPVNNHAGNFYRLVLCVRGYGDVRELNEFFDGRKYVRDRFTRMVFVFLKIYLRSRSLCGINFP